MTLCRIPGSGRAWRSRGRRPPRRPRGTSGLVAAPPATLCHGRRRETGAVAVSGGGGPVGDPGRRCGPMRSRSRRWKMENYNILGDTSEKYKPPVDVVLALPATGEPLLQQLTPQQRPLNTADAEIPVLPHYHSLS